MTPDQQRLSEILDAYCNSLKSVARSEFEAAKKLGAYYFLRYHGTRRALIECRLDNRDLEAMVESLQEQLGDEGLDIDLDDDKS